jgi:hypothetical protein
MFCLNPIVMLKTYTKANFVTPCQAVGDDTLGTRQRLAEVYRRSRPLILHLIKTDKSPMKNMKKLSIARSMMDAGKKERFFNFLLNHYSFIVTVHVHSFLC